MPGELSGSEVLLKNFLVDTGVLSRSQIDAALRQAGDKSFVDAIVGSGVISEDELRRASAHALGVPFVTLTKADISIASLLYIPEPLSRTANIIAYRNGENGIEVALLDLADLPSIDYLRTAHRVNVRLTDRSSIKQALLLYQKHLKEKFAGMVQNGKEAADSLLRHALHSGAHYIHLEPASAEAAGLVVKYRIEGVLREAMRLPSSASTYIVERLKKLGNLFPVSTTVQEGSFSFMHDGEQVGVAITTVPTARGEKLTMRMVRHATGVVGFSLQTLGLHGNALEVLHNALHTKRGVVLVAGTKGSGKTTLLYTLLDHVTTPHSAVATVEEHIEFRMPNVHQTATRPDLGLTTPAALRSVLRQDPDAVLVGEIDSEGSAPLALHAAERGVFILGGVTVNRASEAFSPLLSQGVSARMLALNVKAVVAQRVLHKLCPHASSRTLSRGEGEILERHVRFSKVLAALKQEGVLESHVAWKDVVFYTAKPCAECESISPLATEGFIGFTGVQEVLEVTPGVGQLIAAGAYDSEIEEEAKNGAMLTLLEDALFKAVQGHVSIEEVVELALE